MINVKEELKNPASYIVLVFGLLLGAGILAIVANYRMKSMSQSQLNSMVGQNNTQIPNGTTTPQVSPSYQKALQNPDKPFTDERGVVHPPLGGAGVVTNTTVTPPPVGGSAPVIPVAPKAPAVTPAPTPTVKTATTTVR